MCGDGRCGGLGGWALMDGKKMLKESLGKIRICSVLQAQSERIPEVRNHQISYDVSAVLHFHGWFPPRITKIRFSDL